MTNFTLVISHLVSHVKKLPLHPPKKLRLFLQKRSTTPPKKTFDTPYQNSFYLPRIVSTLSHKLFCHPTPPPIFCYSMLQFFFATLPLQKAFTTTPPNCFATSHLHFLATTPQKSFPSLPKITLHLSMPKTFVMSLFTIPQPKKFFLPGPLKNICHPTP